MKRKIYINFYAYVLIFAFSIAGLLGCATTPLPQPPIAQPNIPGVYYKVEKGQTLWRISKMFNVELEELARINHIPDSSSIETGQTIFIPQQPKQEQQPMQLPGQNFPADDFIWPIRGRVISAYGTTFRNMLNKGINIQPFGNRDVLASRSGKVVFCAEEFRGFGKTIIIDHSDGLFSVYARGAMLLVKPGDIVQRGTVIAKAGATGKNKFTYLHFEIRKGNISQNPLYYLP